MKEQIDIHLDLVKRCEDAGIDPTLYTHRTETGIANVIMCELLGAEDGWAWYAYPDRIDDVIANTLPESFPGSGYGKINAQPIDRSVTT